MRVFVTGASGWIGSALVPELLGAGHQVVGLARSEASADKLAALGVEPLRGDLTDLDSVRRGARSTDAVVHLAYNHDFTRMTQAGEHDRAAIAAVGEEYAGSARPVVIPSGLLGLPTGRVATEQDAHDPHPWLPPRFKAEQLAFGLAEDHGVRTSVVRLAPTVHGAGGDWGFITGYVRIARERGTAGYVGDGSNLWPAVHRSDAATLLRLAIERAELGAVLHASAENVMFREIAETVGRQLDLPVTSIPQERVDEHFGALGTFFAAGADVSSAATRERYGWRPSGPSLLDDLTSGVYTT
jgi:nucleoside-diphosphate-sugar epimerase